MQEPETQDQRKHSSHSAAGSRLPATSSTVDTDPRRPGISRAFLYGCIATLHPRVLYNVYPVQSGVRSAVAPGADPPT